MTSPDDDWPAMTRHPSRLRPGLDRDLDAFLDDADIDDIADIDDFEDVAAFLATLHRVVELPAPRPSGELAALIARGLVPQAAAGPSPTPAHRWTQSRWFRRGALAVALSAGISASLAGGAAASDRLPDRAQDAWHRLVDAITRFDGGEQRAHDPAVGAAGLSALDLPRRGGTAANPPAHGQDAVEDASRRAVGAPARNDGSVGSTGARAKKAADREAADDRADDGNPGSAGPDDGDGREHDESSGSATGDDRDGDDGDGDDGQSAPGTGDGDGDDSDEGDVDGSDPGAGDEATPRTGDEASTTQPDSDTETETDTAEHLEAQRSGPAPDPPQFAGADD